MIDADPDNMDLQDWLAFSYLSNKEFAKAIEVYEKLLFVQPDNLSQLFHYGNRLALVGRIDESRKQFERIMILQPASRLAQTAGDELKKLIQPSSTR